MPKHDGDERGSRGQQGDQPAHLKPWEESRIRRNFNIAPDHRSGKVSTFPVNFMIPPATTITPLRVHMHRSRKKWSSGGVAHHEFVLADRQWHVARHCEREAHVVNSDTDCRGT